MVQLAAALPASNPGRVDVREGGFLARPAGSPSPLVSVVIPCFNHGHYLAEAVRSGLGQTYPSVEVVVVDDGSTDNTAEVARSFPEVGYVWRPQGGLSAARNTGMRASRGAYLVFLDADDRLFPDAVALGLAAFAEHPDCGFVYGAYRLFGTKRASKDIYPAFPADPYEAVLRSNFIRMHAAVLFARHVLEEVSGYDESFRAAEDYELYLRIARRHRGRGHHGLVAERRRHGENMSRNSALMLTSGLRALRTHRSLVAGDRRYQAAMREGVRHWQRYYGIRLLAQAATALGTPGRRREGVRCIVTVFRLAPHALPAAAGKMLRYLAKGLLRRGTHAARVRPS